MHYIRFLKSPTLSRPSPDSADILISAKITVTSDLGESFLCTDLPLQASLLDASFRPSNLQKLAWKAGARSLDIALRVVGGAKSPRSPLQGPCRLFVQPRDAVHCPRAMADISKMDAGLEVEGERGGSVLPILSEPLSATMVGNAKPSRRVQRLLTLGNGEKLRIWEETGESIARHIWDAGLTLSCYIHSLSLGTAQPGMDPLPLLQRTLSWQATKVVELGAGCGIVGITLAQCFPKAEVILTDLPEAEEIARYNISCVESSGSKNAGSVKAPPKITYQNLDWLDPSLPANLRQGDLDVIVVADCTYNVDALPDLVQTLAALVRYNKDAMILLATKPRHDSEQVFFELMAEKQMIVMDNLLVPLTHIGEEKENVEIYLFVNGTELW